MAHLVLFHYTTKRTMGRPHHTLGSQSWRLLGGSSKSRHADVYGSNNQRLRNLTHKIWLIETWPRNAQCQTSVIFYTKLCPTNHLRLDITSENHVKSCKRNHQRHEKKPARLVSLQWSWDIKKTKTKRKAKIEYQSHPCSQRVQAKFLHFKAHCQKELRIIQITGEETRREN